MKTAVVSYSLTGNNEALADSIARELSADHIKITEPKKRTNSTIYTDLIFHKTPKVQPEPAALKEYDRIIFLGPVWIGQVTTPLRAYLKQISTRPCRYAFVSLSGGSLGPNRKLEEELTKRTGLEPVTVTNMYIADLLPSDPKPTMKLTSTYRLNDSDKQKLVKVIVKTLEEAFTTNIFRTIA